MEGFYTKEGGPRNLLAEEEDYSRWVYFPLEEQGILFSFGAWGWGVMERAHVAVYFIGADQKIPEWLVKTYISGGGWNCG